MLSMKRWFKEQLSQAELSLRHYSVHAVQQDRGNGNYGVDYYRANNPKAPPVATLDGDRLIYLDQGIPQEQVENHACAFRALLGRVTGMTIVKPVTAEDAKVLALRAHLLAS